ncbi:hypothetical protein QJQ45_024013 [Haematococcus lacustris]|nr:hypothetical protein QJQ45_024013 [Haematococcus lacustris]
MHNGDLQRAAAVTWPHTVALAMQVESEPPSLGVDAEAQAVNEAAPSQDQPAVGAPVDTVDAAAAPGGIDAADISAFGAAATGREASLAEAEEGVAAAPPMSKSKMKKLAKFEQRKERKEQRRASEKAAKQASKAVKRQEVKAARQTMTEEERKAAAEKAQVASLQRKKEHEERQAKLRQALEPGNQRLAIDLDFAALMSEGDQRHLVQQLSYSYSANGSVAKPCHMHLLWGPGPLRPLAFKMLPGLVNWRVTSAEQTWQQYFKDKLDEVVYLTADSPNELTALDPSKVYVIGGLIDRNRHKGLCFNRAQDAGVATARLPIQKHVQLDSSAVLAVNHVVQIIAEFANSGDWGSVLCNVLPKRKLLKNKAAGKRRREETSEGDTGEGSDVEQALAPAPAPLNPSDVEPPSEGATGSGAEVNDSANRAMAASESHSPIATLE